MITGAHSKSAYSSGFNPILKKFYEMICEIIVSKTVWRIFLIFCRYSFINNFMVKNNFSEPKNQLKSNISRLIYFKKISAYSFVDLICTNKLEGFFFGIFFSSTWNFFHDCNRSNLSVIFFHKKLILYFFSKVIIRKTAKKWWFYSFR